MTPDRAFNAQILSTAEKLAIAGRVVAGVRARGESLDDALDAHTRTITDARGGAIARRWAGRPHRDGHRCGRGCDGAGACLWERALVPPPRVLALTASGAGRKAKTRTSCVARRRPPSACLFHPSAPRHCRSGCRGLPQTRPTPRQRSRERGPATFSAWAPATDRAR